MLKKVPKGAAVQETEHKAAQPVPAAELPKEAVWKSLKWRWLPTLAVPLVQPARPLPQAGVAQLPRVQQPIVPPSPATALPTPANATQAVAQASPIPGLQQVVAAALLPEEAALPRARVAVAVKLAKLVLYTSVLPRRADFFIYDA